MSPRTYYEMIQKQTEIVNTAPRPFEICDELLYRGKKICIFWSLRRIYPNVVTAHVWGDISSKNRYHKTHEWTLHDLWEYDLFGGLARLRAAMHCYYDDNFHLPRAKRLRILSKYLPEDFVDFIYDDRERYKLLITKTDVATRIYQSDDTQ